LTDIGNDNSINGGTLGYFYSKDTLLKSSTSGSNEKIMLYADSVLFANSEWSWSINDFWPKEIISTLAHEFQHIISFYEKTILLTNNNPTDTWISEMLSESTEDLVATKINHTGPRGVMAADGSAGGKRNTKGRYPLFNRYNALSLTSWRSESPYYSEASAFGAFLMRNYGGAKVLHDIMYNRYLDERSVVYAVRKAPNGADKTFNDLIKEWGIAVLLSDNDNLSNLPTYNTGAFTLNRYRNSTYKLGSVNFFNYYPLPRMQASVGTIEGQGNYYYKVGDNLSGTVNISLKLNNKIEATLIVK